MQPGLQHCIGELVVEPVSFLLGFEMAAAGFELFLRRSDRR